MTRLIPKSTLSYVVALALAAPALAGDVTVRLDSGAGFSVRNSTGAIERLRVDEATGNVSRNGALFVHTSGTNNTFVGAGAGNPATSGPGGNSAFGANTLSSNTTGSANTAVGSRALFTNSSGDRNSALGTDALRSNTTGYGNAAVGYKALDLNTTGNTNAAVGFIALRVNTSGAFNAAFGAHSLRANTTGGFNSAVGYGSLRSNTTGGANTAVGILALAGNTSGFRNTALGRYAGQNQTTGSDNIYLANMGVAGETGQIKIGTSGTHTRAFVAGIRGETTVNADAIPVLIDSAGQLGTVSSSLSVKTDIRDMGDATARLLELRPVTFRYREQSQTLPGGGAAPPEYGLVAEEVAEVFPDLVVYDEHGKPFTVKYHEMAPMLLNEMKRQRTAHEQEIAALTARLARLERQAGEGSR